MLTIDRWKTKFGGQLSSTARWRLHGLTQAAFDAFAKPAIVAVAAPSISYAFEAGYSRRDTCARPLECIVVST
jgi:hypothetical protein